MQEPDWLDLAYAWRKVQLSNHDLINGVAEPGRDHSHRYLEWQRLLNRFVDYYGEIEPGFYVWILRRGSLLQL